MLRVVLVVSNFLEAPNGGGAGSNRQPAGRFSLRERCDCRGNNPQPAAKDLRAVALRTRKQLAEPIVSFQHYNAVVRPEDTGSPEYTKLQPTGANLRLITVAALRCGRTEDPPFAAGEFREETTN